MNLCECGKTFPEECARDCVKAERDQLRALVKEMAIFVNSMDDTLLPAASLWYSESLSLKIWTVKAKKILSRPEVKAALDAKTQPSS